jgi:hypothetical protein
MSRVKEIDPDYAGYSAVGQSALDFYEPTAPPVTPGHTNSLPSLDLPPDVTNRLG